jgi:hypothetical protein
LQRPALTLSDGVVYLAFASQGDVAPYHGWVLGYDVTGSTLQLSAVFNTTPNGDAGGIWQSGDTLDVDSQGYLYMATGNGTMEGFKNKQGQTAGLDANGFPVHADYGDSVLKLAVDPTSTASNPNANGWGLKMVDYFTPFNQLILDTRDHDLGSGGPMLLPDVAGSSAHPHLLVEAGKLGTIYLIDRDHMGHFDANVDNVVQELPQALNREYGTAAYFNNTIYYVGSKFGDVARAFSIVSGVLSSSPTSTSSDLYSFPGSTPSISAKGTSRGIVWDLDRGTGQLRAYDAANYGNELYTSAQAPFNRDQLGSVVKFTVPTIANGRVYVGTATALVAYGLLPVATTVPAAPGKLTATAVSGPQIDLTWQDNAHGESGYLIEESTDGTNFAQIATAGTNATSFAVTGLQLSTVYTFRVRGFNARGNSGYSAPVSAATPAGVGTGGLDFSSGFASTAGLRLNGVATSSGSNLQLTDGTKKQVGSAFGTSAVAISRFTTQFNFQVTANEMGGFTFTIQGAGPGALGSGGLGLGYAGLNNSLAIKFDDLDDAEEGYDSTGLYINGATPTLPAIDLSNSGIDLDNGHVFNVGMSYNGTTLTVTITDPTLQVSATHAYTIDIPTIVGSSSAFVGFTASSLGKTSAIQDIQSWTFTPVASAGPAAPSDLTATATTSTEVSLSWTDTSSDETGFLIERKAAGGAFMQIATVGAGVTSYSDDGLSTGTTYVYRVRAINSAGNSAYSNRAQVTTPPGSASPPTPRSNAALADLFSEAAGEDCFALLGQVERRPATVPGRLIP